MTIQDCTDHKMNRIFLWQSQCKTSETELNGLSENKQPITDLVTEVAC